MWSLLGSYPGVSLFLCPLLLLCIWRLELLRHPNLGGGGKQCPAHHDALSTPASTDGQLFPHGPIVMSQHQFPMSKFPPSPPFACILTIQTPAPSGLFVWFSTSYTSLLVTTGTFQIFPDLDEMPGGLCGDRRLWLLCSSNRILDVTILPGVVLLPGTF